MVKQLYFEPKTEENQWQNQFVIRFFVIQSNPTKTDNIDSFNRTNSVSKQLLQLCKNCIINQKNVLPYCLILLIAVTITFLSQSMLGDHTGLVYAQLVACTKGSGTIFNNKNVQTILSLAWYKC